MMSKFLSVAKIVGLIAVVVAAGLLLGWLAGRNPHFTAPSPSSGLASSGIPDASPSLATRLQTNTSPHRLRRQSSSVGATATTAAPNPNLITNWEERVDDILVGEGPESEKAKKMLAMFPNLPETGQVAVAQHLSNLVPDEDYASLSRFLTDPTVSEQVLDILFGDALNRPNSLKLPALLDVARDPDNPKGNEARDILELFLQEDYGTDWNIWQVKVEQWLKDNPD